MARKYTSPTFDYDKDFSKLDFRKRPDQYQVGIGEQGVLLVEPYKSEILPYWRFKTPAVAEKSAKKIYALFRQYKKAGDFVGMDMARKFLQMGYTRSRRYANHSSGRKYKSNPQKAPTKLQESRMRQDIIRQEADWATNEKAQSARIFYGWYKKANTDLQYAALRKEHKRQYG